MIWTNLFSSRQVKYLFPRREGLFEVYNMASEGIHSGFETRGRYNQKSKTGASVAPQKGLMSSNFFKKKCLINYRFVIAGCMLCFGRSNYFRFNHPEEAKRIKESTNNRRSFTSTAYLPQKTGKCTNYWCAPLNRVERGKCTRPR